jgi:deoxyribodipyrimidine photo-lyase
VSRDALLPNPPVGGELAWVAEHLGHLSLDGPSGVRRSGSHRGTQAAADAALAGLDLRGYAARRNEVLPRERRAATGLSPWIRHGLLSLPEVWEVSGAATGRDRDKFRDELLWQEYARHVYARLGSRTGAPLRFEADERPTSWGDDPWDRTMACVAETLDELETDGWIVNQTRMWLASQWTVRGGAAWRDGEDRLFRHLLDGSRAANRLGWQWTVGAGTGSAYGFSRWQVAKRSPGTCAGCDRRHDCPIDDWPDERAASAVEPEALLDGDHDVRRTGGPAEVVAGRPPGWVWLTAESLGARDPALSARPDLPVVFVFDEALLARLQLSSLRLVFLVERLAELAAERPTEVWLGDPGRVLSGRSVVVTYAPVPGFRRLVDRLDADSTTIHPWPWLRRPSDGTLRSFTAWARTSLRSRR